MNNEMYITQAVNGVNVIRRNQVNKTQDTLVFNDIEDLLDYVVTVFGESFPQFTADGELGRSKDDGGPH